MKVNIKTLYDMLEHIKTLNARIEIAKELDNKNSKGILADELKKWNLLLEEFHKNGKHTQAYILNDYYYLNMRLDDIAHEQIMSKAYVQELKRNACEYIIENKLYKYL